jgi:hypothetical protein
MTFPECVCRFAVRMRVLSAVVVAITLIGCSSDDRVPVQRIELTVMCENAPAEHALLVLQPVDAGSEPTAIKPTGYVAADGLAVLTTYETGDGVPAGDYRVTVEWPGPDPDADPDSDDPEAVASGPDQLAGAYLRPESTPLVLTVRTDSNEPRIIELERPRQQARSRRGQRR